MHNTVSINKGLKKTQTNSKCTLIVYTLGLVTASGTPLGDCAQGVTFMTISTAGK